MESDRDPAGGATVDWQLVVRQVRRAQGGDQEAFRGLILANAASVTATILASGIRDRDTAHDLAQEVAIRCWRKLGSLDDPRAFPAWLRQIAANATRDHLRRSTSDREEPIEAAAEIAGEEDPEAETLRRSEVARMRTILADEPDTDIVRLLTAQAEGVAIGDLAQRLGVTPAALKMRMSRARRRLRKRLREL